MVDGMAEDANEAVPVIATVVVPVRPIVPVAESVGHTRDRGHAPGIVLAREANPPAARTPDLVALWIVLRIIESPSSLRDPDCKKLGSENDPAKKSQREHYINRLVNAN